MSQALMPLLALFGGMFSIQFGASIAKKLFPLVGIYGATTLRLFLASFILLIIWRPWRAKLDFKAYKAIIIYGIALGMMNLLFYLSLGRIPLGIAVALEFTGPLAVAIFHSRKLVDFIWALLAVVGMYLLLPLAGQSNLDLTGIAYALGAGFCWAMYILYGQKAGKDLHAGIVTSLGMFVAALIVTPFFIIFSETRTFPLETLPLAFLVAILSSALPYSLEMIALKRIPAKTFGILMSLEPAIAAMMGFLFLHENLDTTQLIAILCIIAASLGGTLTARMKKN